MKALQCLVCRANLDDVGMGAQMMSLRTQPGRISQVHERWNTPAIFGFPSLDHQLTSDPGGLTHGERKRLSQVFQQRISFP
jgi:hypothetical protein